ncbi:hypothetical protein [Solilutibacter silvestris]|uniref:Uncharacterized protein n=1 Tax=Solilutibacter silvestris TaxID=1645665 RepID=A0A2K1PYF7_9GAMM|nr:hypothetical protein [Lysobacter silvestris]PNS07821.1 hypothetical protein Lysil_1997 [Lysobacter silvestris]
MDMLAPFRQPRNRTDRKPDYTDYEFLTHDQRPGGVRELGFDELDERERTIFLRCGFRAPQMA